MVQYLRMFAAFVEDPSLAISTLMVTLNHAYLQFWGSNAHFSPLLAPGTHMVHIQTCGQISHTH